MVKRAAVAAIGMILLAPQQSDVLCDEIARIPEQPVVKPHLPATSIVKCHIPMKIFPIGLLTVDHLDHWPPFISYFSPKRLKDFSQELPDQTLTLRLQRQQIPDQRHHRFSRSEAGEQFRSARMSIRYSHRTGIVKNRFLCR